MYICMYVGMFVCMYVCMYVCIMYVLCMYVCVLSSLGIVIYFWYRYLLVIRRFTSKRFYRLDIPMEWVLHSKKNVCMDYWF